MAGRRSLTSTLALTLGLGMAACSTLDSDDYCRYSENIPIRDAHPDSLALVLGIGRGRARENPFVVVRSISAANPGASVKLQAMPAVRSLPANLDESRCARVDWRTYSLTVDAEEWGAFWQDESNALFEIFIGFLDSNEQLLMSDFGAAIVDTTAGEYVVACGCYWK